MSRAEDLAKKRNPTPKLEDGWGDIKDFHNAVDSAYRLRAEFKAGYEQAIEDMAWIAIGEKIKQGDFSVDKLTKAMEGIDLSCIVNAINSSKK
jgi:hypothetical protein